MSWPELATELKISVTVARKRFATHNLDGDEQVSLAYAFDLPDIAIPDGRVSDLKIKAGLAKLRAKRK